MGQKTKTEGKTQSEDTVRFEESMQKLSDIVSKLENGEGSLDEMIQLYEQGMTLVKTCEKQLDSYEAIITKLNDPTEAIGDAE